MLTFILFVVSIILTIIITRYYSMRKILSLVVFSVVDIIDLRRVRKEKIKVLYQNEPIDFLWAIRVIVQNDGNSDIDKELVRSLPRIELSEHFKVIDVETRYINKNSSIKASIEGGRIVVFEIEYLQRKQYAAFQILVHSAEEIKLDSKQITFDKGAIKDTDIKTINLLKSGMPVVMSGFLNFLNKSAKIILWLYIIFGSGIIVAGLILMAYPPFANLIEPNAPLFKRLLAGILYILLGTIFVVPMLYARKKIQYFNLFLRGNSEDA